MWSECCQCSLKLYTEKVVAPRGGCKKRVMFIGEAPGAEEEKLGLAFVGRSGEMLDYWLDVLGLNSEDVYITNVVKCRPPENRDPKPAEIQACLPWLHKEIEELKPVYVITLGRFAQDVTAELKQVHGDFRSLALKHPAYYLRQGFIPGDQLRFLKRRLAMVFKETDTVEEFR